NQQRLLIAQELLADLDVPIGDLFRLEVRRFLMQPRLDQVLAIERAIDGHFALGAAANRADFAAPSGAIAAGFAGVAEAAFHGRSYSHRSIGESFPCFEG